MVAVTANIEYQALTGLSMANYSDTLSIAYQQLVPGAKVGSVPQSAVE